MRCRGRLEGRWDVAMMSSCRENRIIPHNFSRNLKNGDSTSIVIKTLGSIKRTKPQVKSLLCVDHIIESFNISRLKAKTRSNSLITTQNNTKQIKTYGRTPNKKCVSPM